jgi:hypothetical protein
MSPLFYHRLRRTAASGSPVVLGGGTALFGIAFGFLGHQSNDKYLTYYASWLLLGLALVGASLLAIQWWAEYRRRTYDPSWISKFQDEFQELSAHRLASIKAFRKNNEPKQLGKDINVEEVLDFFDSLGFYLQGDQITPEVAHQEFYYWIRGYYSAAKPIIEAAQKKNKTQWAHIRGLFEITNEVERELDKKASVTPLAPDSDDLAEFFKDEGDSQSRKH